MKDLERRKKHLFEQHMMCCGAILINKETRESPIFVDEIGELRSLAGILRCGYRLAELVKETEADLYINYPDNYDHIRTMQREASSILSAAHNDETETILIDQICDFACRSLWLFKPECFD